MASREKVTSAFAPDLDEVRAWLQRMIRALRFVEMVTCAGSFRGPPSLRRRAVVVMQPAEHGDRRDRAGDLGLGAASGERKPLADPLVRPNRVEVAQCVFGQDLLQLRF